jgi:hypothetical protein
MSEASGPSVGAGPQDLAIPLATTWIAVFMVAAQAASLLLASCIGPDQADLAAGGVAGSTAAAGPPWRC